MPRGSAAAAGQFDAALADYRQVLAIDPANLALGSHTITNGAVTLAITDGIRLVAQAGADVAQAWAIVVPVTRSAPRMPATQGAP